jgi:PRTRC genetic system protein C
MLIEHVVRIVRWSAAGSARTLHGDTGESITALLDSIIRSSHPTSIFGEKKMATTTLKSSSLPREFVFNGSRIPDPYPRRSIDQVRDLLTPSYPEIATATITGPEDTGTSLRYSFARAIGSKG